MQLRRAAPRADALNAAAASRCRGAAAPRGAAASPAARWPRRRGRAAMSSPNSSVTPAARSSATRIAATRAPVRIVTPAAVAEATIAAETAPMPPRGSAIPHAVRRLARHAVQEQDQRVRRPRPEPGAERRVEGHKAHQPVVGQVVFEDVGHVDQDHAQKLARLVLAKPPGIEAHARQALEIVAALARQARRRHLAERRQQPGVAVEPLVQRGPGAGVRGVEVRRSRPAASSGASARARSSPCRSRHRSGRGGTAASRTRTRRSSVVTRWASPLTR